MARKNITLEAAAAALSVHPRTIVRALSGKHNTYWSEDINHDIYKIDEIAKAYGLTSAEFNRVIEGRDRLLKPDEAAQVLGVRPRTFRDRVSRGKYRKIIHGRVVRYLRSMIVSDAIANSE